MSAGEIKTPLIELKEGDAYSAVSGVSYVINRSHTASDILRHLIKELSHEEVAFLVWMIERED